MALITSGEALTYHSMKRKGKLEVMPTKPCMTQKDLSLAYTPGVAEACRAIGKDPEAAYDYTNKGNLVAVVSNGTAVLGLGDIGPAAGKPVMEGKAVLFKTFADVDVYDLVIDQPDPDKVIAFCRMLEPTFGGINLEDIKAPECFKIEQTLVREMHIPVFHDDQHGTAIISGAGLLNVLDISGKNIRNLKVVVSGAGAAAIACSLFYESMGMDRSQIFMFDSKGLIHSGRSDLNPQKAAFAQPKDCTLAQAMRGADMFLGLSRKDVIGADEVRSMAKDPIIFACANPDPEVPYPVAKKARPDLIMGTGRSDFPNQINNVLGFPYIFRGALDCRARSINEPMKLAAAKALAALAREPVDKDVCALYGLKELHYGPDCIIPLALDPRVLEWESSAVAAAAMESGVAGRKLDIAAYKKDLAGRMTASKKRIRLLLESYGYDL